MCIDSKIFSLVFVECLQELFEVLVQCQFGIDDVPLGLTLKIQCVAGEKNTGKFSLPAALVSLQP